MNLSIISINPPNGSVNTFLDIPISIEFSQPVDPFTIKNGIGLYTIKKATFGENPIQIETNYSEYVNLIDDYAYFDYNYTIEGNIVTISPIVRLFPDCQYYITVFPGDNGERHVSKATVASPVYTRTASSVGVLNVVTYYKGNNEAIYQILINAGNSFDVLKDGVFQDSFTYTDSVPVSIDNNIGFSLTGVFDEGDLITLNCFPTEGLTSLYQTTFSTSKYVIVEPTSQTIESLGIPLELISSHPKNFSVNNQRCNPITLTFSRNLDTEQNILNNIEITKRDYDTGLTSNITYYYKIMGNILRLYLIGVEH
jgi:hypothetical protein